MNSDKQENNKVLWTKIILILFVVVIFCLWLANLRNVFDNQKPETDDTWKKINEAFQQIENNSNLASSTASSTKENEFVENLLDKASSTASSTATASEEKIKNRLDNIMETATTTVKKNNCPPYINCQPTIGKARACTVPAGCEGITQIAY